MIFVYKLDISSYNVFYFISELYDKTYYFWRLRVSVVKFVNLHKLSDSLLNEL